MSTERAARTREALLAAGYAVAVRQQGWVECLVSRGVEQWLGRGIDEAQALEHAVRQMFPSGLAWELFESFTTQPHADVSTADPPTDSSPPLSDTAPPVADTAPPGSGASATADTSPPDAPNAEPISTVVSIDRVYSESAARTSSHREFAESASGSEPTTTTTTARSVPTVLSDHEVVGLAIERIHALLADIDDSEPELAQLSAERQRLWLLIWICDARIFESDLPWATGVTLAVARVARRLGDLAKVFWPGSVRPLQASARPSEIGLGRRQGEDLPRTWGEAAGLVRQVLADQVAAGKRAGLDEDGWADAASLEPRCSQPDAELEAANRELSILLPAPGTSSIGDVDHSTIERLVHLGRVLRWLRRGVGDPIRWGAAMGRLRHGMVLLGERAELLRPLCDARYRPPQPWARLVARSVAAPPPSSPMPTPTIEPLGEPPPVGSDTSEVVVWLVRAFDAVDGPRLAEILTARRAEICALDESALPSGDRRIRRRFRELVHRLSSREGDLPEEPLSERFEPERDNADNPASGIVLEDLCARIVTHTRGKRALLVTNREDPPLVAKLEELLGVELSTCDGSPRRLQAECTRIANRSFDLVLFAEGFQSHNVDTALVHATRTASVPLVRVGRGRPLACVRAIARELGLAS